MRRAEQQLTRVKVDTIRCHSHFLPKTRWMRFACACVFPLSPAVSSCLFPTDGNAGNKRRKEKKWRFSIPMRRKKNGHKTAQRLSPRRRLVSVFTRCPDSHPLVFLCSRGRIRLEGFTVRDSCRSDAPQAGRERDGERGRQPARCCSCCRARRLRDGK